MSDTRHQILVAAGEIFAEKGFQAATVREICSRAEVNLASVNYYFGDKERLYIEAVKYARRLREEKAPLPDWSVLTRPEDKLRMLIETLLRRMLADDAAPWQMRLVQREIMEPTKACEEMVQEAFRPYFEILVGTLAELLPESVPQHELQQLGFSVVAQCVYYRVHDKIVGMIVPAEDLERYYGHQQLARHITNVTLAAVGAIPPLTEQIAEATSSTNAR